MRVLKMTRHVDADRTLFLPLPPDLPPGTYQIVVVLEPAKVMGLPPVPQAEQPSGGSSPALPKGMDIWAGE